MNGVRVENRTETTPVGPSLVACQRRLRSPDVRTRRQAALDLATLGSEAGPLLQRAIKDDSPLVRAAALESFEKIGDLYGQEQYLELLGSDYPDVREYAVRTLAEIGDERALIPLMTAYRRCFIGQSARKQRLMGPFLLVLWTLLTALTGWEWMTGHGDLKDLLILVAVSLLLTTGSRGRGAAWHSVLQAILLVAERNPSPEVHRLLPELQSLAADRIQNHPEAREAARSAAARIEAMTAACHDLPIPIEARISASAALPIPVLLAAEHAPECGRGEHDAA